VKLECTEIEELTGAYLADQLTVQERFRMEMHLDSCPACTADLAKSAPIAAALNQEVDAEEQEPTMDSHRRESLLALWNQCVPAPSNASPSAWRTLRRAAVTLAIAASVLIASYVTFVSPDQPVRPNAYTLEIASQPTKIDVPTASSDPLDDPQYETAFAGIPYPDSFRVVKSDLPEYGMGSTVFASPYRVSPTRAPYIGLPVPRLNYDFDETSLGNE
jgi:hypothetical protein